jgi:hypothetical protein
MMQRAARGGDERIRFAFAAKPLRSNCAPHTLEGDTK